MVGEYCTIEEMRAKIEASATEKFVLMTVPELFFWELGLEYIGTDTPTFEVKTQ